MTDFIVAIPARHAASRLPGKPLRLLGGTPLVVHVARRALAAGAREVWVATDDTRIRDALLGIVFCVTLIGWATDVLEVTSATLFLGIAIAHVATPLRATGDLRHRHGPQPLALPERNG